MNFIYVDFETEFAEIEQLTTITYLKSLGIVFSYDSRSNVYYPRKGFEANVTFQSYPEFMGNAFVSNKLEIDYNHYFSLRKDHDVIGLRLFTGLGFGDISFNQQLIVGRDDFRGYSEGKYRGDQVVALQGEYRWNPFEKFGVVGFIGLATVFNAIDASYNGLLLPGIGTGIRYTVFPDNKLNVGIDVAVGRDDWGFYFRIGEAF